MEIRAGNALQGWFYASLEPSCVHPESGSRTKSFALLQQGQSNFEKITRSRLYFLLRAKPLMFWCCRLRIMEVEPFRITNLPRRFDHLARKTSCYLILKSAALTFRTFNLLVFLISPISE
jgi:hypothetical protein